MHKWNQEDAGTWPVKLRNVEGLQTSALSGIEQMAVRKLRAIRKTRTEWEKIIEPIVLECQEFVESQGEKPSITLETIRPDVRRVSLISSLAHALLGDSASGPALEVGSGYGLLLFPMATLMPGIQWSAVEHPERAYVHSEAYLRAFRAHNCCLTTANIMREPLPFPDQHFLLVTFSEVLEHLPLEQVNVVLSEIARVLRPGGILIASSPNQVSLGNRVRLLTGKSILEMPLELDYAQGTFGHVRLYTVPEVSSAMSKHGFIVECSLLESNYKGSSNLRRPLHYLYEWLESRIPILRPMGDTWYMAFRKNATAKAV
jgi:SAM-dependent methyltransferase